MIDWEIRKLTDADLIVIYYGIINQDKTGDFYLSIIVEELTRRQALGIWTFKSPMHNIKL